MQSHDPGRPRTSRKAPQLQVRGLRQDRRRVQAYGFQAKGSHQALRSHLTGPITPSGIKSSFGSSFFIRKAIAQAVFCSFSRIDVYVLCIYNKYVKKYSRIFRFLCFLHSCQDFIMEAYKHAVDEKYRFFSFGDAMFIK